MNSTTFYWSPGMAIRTLRRWSLQRKLSLYQKSADVERMLAAQAMKNAAWFEKQAIVAASDLRRIQ